MKGTGHPHGPPVRVSDACWRSTIHLPAVKCLKDSPEEMQPGHAGHANPDEVGFGGHQGWGIKDSYKLSRPGIPLGLTDQGTANGPVHERVDPRASARWLWHSQFLASPMARGLVRTAARRSARPGGSRPHLGHFRRSGSKESSIAAPRVQTSVWRSSSHRKSHSRMRFIASRGPKEQRMRTRQPSEKASPIVSTPMRTKREQATCESRRVPAPPRNCR